MDSCEISTASWTLRSLYWERPRSNSPYPHPSVMPRSSSQDDSRRFGEEPLHEIRVSFGCGLPVAQDIQTLPEPSDAGASVPTARSSTWRNRSPRIHSFVPDPLRLALHYVTEVVSRASRAHTLEYLPARTIAYPLISSRMPSSSENPGLNPVRSIFSLDTM